MMKSEIKQRMADGAIPSFSDFNTNIVLFTGTKQTIKKILDIPIIIDGVRFVESKLDKSIPNKKCMEIHYYIEDGLEEHVSFTNSKVLIAQLMNKNVEFPFRTRICKEQVYYICR